MSDQVQVMDQNTLEHLLANQPTLINQMMQAHRNNSLAPEHVGLFRGLMAAMNEKNRLQQAAAQQQQRQSPAPSQASLPIPNDADLAKQWRELKGREQQAQQFLGRPNISEQDRQQAMNLLHQTQQGLNTLGSNPRLQMLMRVAQAQQQQRSVSPAPPPQAVVQAQRTSAQPSVSLPMPLSEVGTPSTSSVPSISYPSSVATARPEPAPPARPTLSQGLSTLSPAVGSPAIARAPISAGTERGIVSRRKLQELLEMAGGTQMDMDPEVEDLLLEVADEFVDSVTKFACKLAQHRSSDRLEAQDVQLHLERNWGYRIPGWDADMVKVSQSRKTNQPPGYVARLAAAREVQRKRM